MSKSKKEKFDLNDIDSIATEWKPSVVNWDIIQRMRFKNADAEIEPNDSYSTGERKFKKQ